MLAGYTAAIIGFPTVDMPGEIFHITVARCEEISIGILCAWLFHGVLFPRASVPLLRGKLTAWLGDVARFSAASLRGQLDDGRFAAERRRVARDGAALAMLFHPARYELSSKAALLWLPVLREYARRVPALISSIGDRTAALHAEDPQAHAALGPLLEDMAVWLTETAHPAETGASDLAAQRLRERSRLLGEEGRLHPNWTGVLQEGIAARLSELVEHWQECASLGARMLAAEPAEVEPPDYAVRSPGHIDPLLVVLSGISTALGVAIGSAFWIFTAWPSGSGVPMLAAIMASIFAQLDDPAPAIAKFLQGAVLAVLIAAVLLFGVLPAIDGFPMLVAVLAVIYLPAGAFQAVPAFGAAALAVAACLPTLMALDTSYQADFAVFANGGASVLLGIGLSVVVTRLVRSVGLAWRVQRLAQADQRDLLHVVAGQPGELRRTVVVMLDRFEALAARLGATDARREGVAELADLRASVNVLDLREMSDSLLPDLRQRTAAALGALREELQGRGDAADTLARIDDTLTIAMAGPDHAARRAALSLAGLRLARFPDAPPPEPRPQDGMTRSLAA
jgi:uncharacterized membrane protein YccC